MAAGLVRWEGGFHGGLRPVEVPSWRVTAPGGTAACIRTLPPVCLGIHRDAHTLHMGDKVIYVRAEDEPLWDWAVAYARAHRMPVSGLILNALQAYREQVDPER